MTKQPAITCDAALEVMQLRLDGNAESFDPAIAQHLKQCTECRGRFAAADMLLAVYATKATPDFTIRINSAIRTDLRKRQARRWLLAASGLAAAIVLAFRLTIAQPQQKPDEIVAANVPSIEKRLTGARSAIWGWSGRTVGLLGIPDFSEPPVSTHCIEQSIEPATDVLTSAGKGLIEGVEPLTSSAKRATRRFWRDLPSN